MINLREYYHQEYLRITSSVVLDCYGDKMTDYEVNYSESNTMNNYTYYFLMKSLLETIKKNNAFIGYQDDCSQEEKEKYLEYIKTATDLKKSIDKLPGMYILPISFEFIFKEDKVGKDFIGDFIDINNGISLGDSAEKVLNMFGFKLSIDKNQSVITTEPYECRTQLIPQSDNLVRKIGKNDIVGFTDNGIYNWYAVSFNLQLATYLFKRDTYCLYNVTTGDIEYIPAEIHLSDGYKKKFPYIKIGYQKINALLSNLFECMECCDFMGGVETSKLQLDKNKCQYQYCTAIDNDECELPQSFEYKNITVDNIPFIPYTPLYELFRFWASDDGGEVETGLFGINETCLNVINFFSNLESDYSLPLIDRKWINDYKRETKIEEGLKKYINKKDGNKKDDSR